MDLILAGCQAGDEGKGKFTDVLATSAFAVVRYQGGPHTGHTVVVGGRRFRFVQVPAGALRGALGVLGNGCVIEPVALCAEIDALAREGIEVDLAVSETAHVILPYHRVQDEVAERWRGDRLATSRETGFRTGQGQIGSTKRGVGPCREDKIARIGLRMIDLTDATILAARLRRLVPLKRSLLENGFGVPLETLDTYRAEDWDVERLIASYLDYGRRLAPLLCDVSALLAEARKHGQDLVHEGAQSVSLDVEHGTYPFCSSGYSAASGVTVGTGSSPRLPFEVFGVMKAYMGQVGGGPMPTELEGEVADYIVERGSEYGTVTGRRRRVGWLDLCFVRKALQVDGFSHLCISSLDVLAGLPEVKIATHYLADGERLDIYPAGLRQLALLEPVYETLPGWPEQDWAEVVRGGLGALPQGARDYITLVTESLGVEVAAVSVGPGREDTIVRYSPFRPGPPHPRPTARRILP